MIFNLRVSIIAALLIALTFSGCSGARRVRPQARVPAQPNSANKTATPESGDGTFGDGTPQTKEELREEKATVKVLDNLPDRDLSRDEVTKLVQDEEKNIPDEELVLPEPNTTPSTTPSVTPSTTPIVTPSTTPSPVPVKVEPKVPEKKPEKTSETKPVDDNGIDSDDEQFTSTYTGPKTVAFHPTSTDDFKLSETAAKLGSMTPKSEYRSLQKDLMGSSLRSCNFFFAAALIEAKAPDSHGIPSTPKNFPLWQAAVLDTKYFAPAGWEQITLPEMKQWFQEGRSFDVAIQRDAPKGKQHGHVAIPIGLNAQGNVMVAEASYLKESNRISVYSDASLSSKFRIFARYK